MPLVAASLFDAVWRLAGKLPPLAAWRLIHSTPPGIVEAVSRLTTRGANDGYSTRFLGYELANPLGLAAGFDKDGSLTWLARGLRLGFHVVGSVLAKPHAGVEQKILVRLPGGATVNRLGLPSPGAQHVARNLSRRPPGLAIAASIAGFRVEDYLLTLRVLEPHVDWFEVNISCPNVEEHRSFENPETAARLAQLLARAARKPLLLKIPPTLDRDLLQAYADIVSSYGLAGVVATNTLPIQVAGVPAGLGGAPLYPRVRRILQTLRDILPSSKVIVAVGGIDSTEKALALLEEGASLIELLSPLVLRGPLHVARMAEQLSTALAQRASNQYT